MFTSAIEESVRPFSLTGRIANQFRTSGRGELRKVTIHEQHGAVTLSGRVPSFYMKQMAQELAVAVQGVQTIRNETIVCSS